MNPRSIKFIFLISRYPEMSEEEVEYELDEEDNLWLSIINSQFSTENHAGFQITEEQFEAIMDSFEKEAYSICSANELENQINRTIDGIKWINIQKS